jgi:hypothetical protein
MFCLSPIALRTVGELLPASNLNPIQPINLVNTQEDNPANEGLPIAVHVNRDNPTKITIYRQMAGESVSFAIAHGG